MSGGSRASRPRRAARALLLVLGIVAMVAPGGAGADHCDGPITVFSRASNPGPTQVNPPAPSETVCTVTQDHLGTERRALLPAADQVLLRYVPGRDIDARFGFITTRLWGLGWSGEQSLLFRSVYLNGRCCPYDSAWLPLPAGRAAAGCLTVVVTLPDETQQETRVPSFGATC